MPRLTFAAARKNVGLTQEDACREIGISKATLSYYESGTREPTFSTLCKMADVYGCSLDDFRRDKNEEGEM